LLNNKVKRPDASTQSNNVFFAWILNLFGIFVHFNKLPNGFFPQDNEKRFCDLLERRYNFAALKTSLRNEFCLTDIKSVFCFVILHQVIMIVL